jgi:hypothetical protein
MFIGELELRNLKARSEAIDEIEKIVNAIPEEDEHGNSEPYAYRFDKTISDIMDVLDEVKASEIVWQAPWKVV